MAKPVFIRFVGNAFLNGKDVVAYKVDGGIRLAPETLSGKSVGPSKTVSEEEFDNLLSLWTRSGALARGDVRITQAALDYVGIHIE
jgi:hypothetical protein